MNCTMIFNNGTIVKVKAANLKELAEKQRAFSRVLQAQIIFCHAKKEG